MYFQCKLRVRCEHIDAEILDVDMIPVQQNKQDDKDQIGHVERMFHQIIGASLFGRRPMDFSPGYDIKLFGRYCSVIENITRREFRDRRDTPPACYGALSMLAERANTVLIYGLLASEFTHSLGWTPQGVAYEPLPTRSWATTNRAIEFTLKDLRHRVTHISVV